VNVEGVLSECADLHELIAQIDAGVEAVDALVLVEVARLHHVLQRLPQRAQRLSWGVRRGSSRGHQGVLVEVARLHQVLQ
jgi:hypothetical protein